MNFKDAIANGGALLMIATFALGNLTGEQVQPVDSLKANAPAAAPFNPCPEGWLYTEEAEHAVRLTCARDGWVVVLDPAYQFNNALDTRNPQASPILDPSAVPGWR